MTKTSIRQKLELFIKEHYIDLDNKTKIQHPWYS